MSKLGSEADYRIDLETLKPLQCKAAFVTVLNMRYTIMDGSYFN